MRRFFVSSGYEQFIQNQYYICNPFVNMNTHLTV